MGFAISIVLLNGQKPWIGDLCIVNFELIHSFFFLLKKVIISFIYLFILKRLELLELCCWFVPGRLKPRWLDAYTGLRWLKNVSDRLLQHLKPEYVSRFVFTRLRAKWTQSQRWLCHGNSNSSFKPDNHHSHVNKATNTESLNAEFPLVLCKDTSSKLEILLKK